ncbi:hypothetical protein DFS34DRAFT_675223 [Phlyctochytrium arcticum]|nr:hypothetical protein DFS34DRAFT_695192 [Phlyctochytrium arcticum]KAI9101667.1 hypothetical protein DFS34DRAFT_675185 [Phlyctochytrium arcticum]KAI9101681.1 hypothetical protein DFS34DRAFT_675223 [Phlyctochytrium arcticum]
MPLPLRNIQYLGLTWTGNNVVDRSGAMNHVIQQLEPDQFPILSFTTKYKRLYTAVTSSKLAALVAKNRGLYEIILPERKRKVYFDIDPKDNLTLDEIKSKILAQFPNARLHISGRHPNGEEAGSYHVVLSNYYTDNLDETRNTTRRFADANGFDTAVHSTNQQFKCINQSKPGKPVQAYMEGSNDPLKHLVMHGFDDCHSA